MRLKSLYYLLIISFLAFSCNLSDDETQTIVTVDPEFSIGMFELLGTPPQFQFLLETFEEQQCLNSIIDNSIVTQNRNISLFIKEVQTTSDCTPGIAPAYGSATAGFLQPGSYEVIISLKNAVESTGMLVVSEEMYQFEVIEENGVVSSQNTLYRIPEKTIWGYVAYDDEEQVGNEPAAFINDLEEMLEPTVSSDGNYGYFDISGNDLLNLRSSPNKAFVETFYFSVPTDTKNTETLIEEYRNGEVGDAMEIKIFTWDGRTL